MDPEPTYRIEGDERLATHTLNYFLPRHTQVQKVKCADPDWMKSKTYYPPATICYKDPSESSCFQNGNSGSSVMAHFNAKFNETHNVPAYAFTGPLSMHKGCDQTLTVHGEFIYGSKNPGVFTDARCYMHWIAAIYGMMMPQGYEMPSSCGQSSGRKDDIEKSTCRVQTNHYIPKQRFIPCPAKLRPTGRQAAGGKPINCTQVPKFTLSCSTGTISGCYDVVDSHVTGGYCDWSQKDDDDDEELWDRCRLVAAEGFSYNIFRCKDRYGEIGTCSNNCRGVDPNAIIIGGSAVLGAASLGGLTILQAAGLGAIGAGAIGVGGASVLMNNRCPNTRPCRGRDRRNPRRFKCCRTFGTGQGARCGTRRLC
jgi:hypothetical protein